MQKSSTLQFVIQDIFLQFVSHLCGKTEPIFLENFTTFKKTYLWMKDFSLNFKIHPIILVRLGGDLRCPTVLVIYKVASTQSSFITVLHVKCRRGIAMRILSVRLSVTRVNCDKTDERSVQIFIPYERYFSLVY